MSTAANHYAVRMVHDDLKERTDDPSVVTVPWRQLAIGSGVLTVAAVGALVVVVTVAESQALTTIALALAILSFVIQLIVFISQTASANQQLLRSEQINSDTRALLNRLQVSAEGTSTMLQEQFNRVLDHALGGATSSGQLMEEDELRSRLEESWRALSPPSSFYPHLSSISVYQSDEEMVHRANRQAEARRLRTYPSYDEVESVLPVLQELTPLESGMMRAAFDDEVRDLRIGGSPTGLPMRSGGSPWHHALLEKGLIQITEKNEHGQHRIRLTDRGRLVGRVLGANETDIPQYVLDLWTPG